MYTYYQSMSKNGIDLNFQVSITYCNKTMFTVKYAIYNRIQITITIIEYNF